MKKQNRSYKKFVWNGACPCCREQDGVGYIIDAKAESRVQRSKRRRNEDVPCRRNGS